MPLIQNIYDHLSYPKTTIEWMTALPYKPKVLAVIPARGGSKGLKRKNARLLCGKPLVSYSIEIALRSQLIDRVVVSTDDPEIAEISDSHGEGIALYRPAELAGDRASIGDVVTHARKEMIVQGYKSEYIVTLLPTHPFRTPALVDRLTAIGLFEGRRVITVRRIDISQQKYFFLEEDGPRQISGGHDQEWFRPYGTYVGEFPDIDSRVYLHVIKDECELVDIDYLEDFLLAEHIITNRLYDFNTC